MIQVDTTRVVIVGAGLAALYAALSLAPRPVLILSPDPLGQGSSSTWAQGGVAAAMDPADSAAAHAHDTVLAGAGIVDAQVASSVADEARAHILELTGFGTPFDRTATGGYVMSREAAHSFARVVRVRGDQAGTEIMQALTAQVRQAAHIQILEGVMATRLAVEDGAVFGVEVARCASGMSAPCLIRAPAVLLAGGGSGGLYALTTNPPRVRGQVIGMAARAGAVIADAEFVQFHPTAIACGLDPAPLATEALRGEGALLVNRHGERFMQGAHPDAELAPRDIVARAVFAQTQNDLAPALDTRAALGARVMLDFPAVAAACLASGLDPVTQTIPIAAAAHYHMGGIATDAAGRTSLGQLWACGEAASTGLHGANRLASNGLLEALVFGRRAAQDIIGALAPVAQEHTAPVALPPLPSQAEPRSDLVRRLRHTMTNDVGVIRTGQGLVRALDQISRIETAQPDCEALQTMTATATLIAAAALNRRESRGAHFRSDFAQSDGDSGTRSFLTLTEARTIARLETT